MMGTSASNDSARGAALRQAALPCMLAVGLAVGLAHAPPAAAAPDPPPLVEAGPQPTQDQARQAVLDALKGAVSEPADLLRVRFASGPHLIEAITFADNREQAWQMCVVRGDANISKGSPSVELTPFFLRVRHGVAQVLPVVNWKTFDLKC